MTVDGFDLLRRHPRVGVGKFHAVVAKAARQHFCIDCEKVERYCETCSTMPSNIPCQRASPFFSQSPKSRTVPSFVYRMTVKAFPTARGLVFSNHSFELIRHDQRKPAATVGLSMCKRIVEAHGATIYIESNPVESTKKGRTVRPFFVRLSQVCYVRSRWQDVDT